MVAAERIPLHSNEYSHLQIEGTSVPHTYHKKDRIDQAICVVAYHQIVALASINIPVGEQGRPFCPFPAEKEHKGQSSTTMRLMTGCSSGGEETQVKRTGCSSGGEETQVKLAALVRSLGLRSSGYNSRTLSEPHVIQLHPHLQEICL
jgi:hypothetical protein